MSKQMRVKAMFGALLIGGSMLAVAAGSALAEPPGTGTTGQKSKEGLGTQPEKDKKDQPGMGAKKGAVVGEAAPDFKLKDTEGKEWNLSQLTKEGKIVVLEWFNPECPFVVKHHKVNKTMADLSKEFKEKGVVWLAVNSGAPGLQGAGLEKNKQAREDFKIEYPVLLDEKGEVGRAYGAKTTPHMFVIDKDGVLRYAGAIDNNKSPTEAGDTNYVKNALLSVINGETVAVQTERPYGCSVKYGSK